jgi:hypothetical protein
VKRGTGRGLRGAERRENGNLHWLSAVVVRLWMVGQEEVHRREHGCRMSEVRDAGDAPLWSSASVVDRVLSVATAPRISGVRAMCTFSEGRQDEEGRVERDMGMQGCRPVWAPR